MTDPGTPSPFSSETAAPASWDARVAADLEGSCSRGVGVGVAVGEPQPGQTLVAAVVESPRGSLFPRLFGPRDGVVQRRGAFLDLVRGIGSGGGAP